MEDRNINEASLFPDSWSYEKEYKPYEKFYRGVQAEIDGNALEAISLYTEAIDLNPDFVDAYKRRARIRYYKLDLKGAQYDIEKVFDLEQRNGLYDASAEDELIGFHPFCDEQNAGCMHRILGKIYEFYGDKLSSKEYLRQAKNIQRRYERREKKESEKK